MTNEIKVKTGDCPLGAKCETVKTEPNGEIVIYRCPWFIKVKGHDSNTGDEIEDFNCAIAWMPALMINTANEARKNVAATESFRNEVISHAGTTRVQNVIKDTGVLDLTGLLDVHK